jgi:hypothetical protein
VSWDARPWGQRLGDATSQWFNVALFAGMPDESLSGRSWRSRDRTLWRVVGRIANTLFRDPEHCRLAYEQDLERARLRCRETLTPGQGIG